MNQKNAFSFEKSFNRLEEILEEMNGSNLSLEKSLLLYEEANGLMKSCNDYLIHAEKKIETLIKTRDGAISLDDEGKPLVENFAATHEQILTSDTESTNT